MDKNKHQTDFPGVFYIYKINQATYLEPPIRMIELSNKHSLKKQESENMLSLTKYD